MNFSLIFIKKYEGFWLKCKFNIKLNLIRLFYVIFKIEILENVNWNKIKIELDIIFLYCGLLSVMNINI